MRSKFDKQTDLYIEAAALGYQSQPDRSCGPIAALQPSLSGHHEAEAAEPRRPLRSGGTANVQPPCAQREGAFIENAARNIRAILSLEMTHVTSIDHPGGGPPQRSRDDFPAPIKEMLAKRVGYLCSNPDCRKPTSGPQENPTKAINIGVAAHISAASPGGPRYDAGLTAEERSAIANGIWLCQNCAKMIDSDPTHFSSYVLRGWRDDSESRALVALHGPATTPPDPKFVKLERLMPELLAEMRKDFADNPLCREAILLQKNWSFWYPDRAMFTYYTDDHADLTNKFAVLQNYSLVWNISNNNVPRYSISEELAEYCQS